MNEPLTFKINIVFRKFNKVINETKIGMLMFLQIIE